MNSWSQYEYEEIWRGLENTRVCRGHHNDNLYAAIVNSIQIMRKPRDEGQLPYKDWRYSESQRQQDGMDSAALVQEELNNLTSLLGRDSIVAYLAKGPCHAAMLYSAFKVGQCKSITDLVQWTTDKPSPSNKSERWDGNPSMAAAGATHLKPRNLTDDLINVIKRAEDPETAAGCKEKFRLIRDLEAGDSWQVDESPEGWDISPEWSCGRQWLSAVRDTLNARYTTDSLIPNAFESFDGMSAEVLKSTIKLHILSPHGFFMSPGVWVHVSLPLVMHHNDQDQPHNDEGPAYQYADGSTAWMLEGYDVGEGTVLRPTEQKVRDITSERNAEKRRIKMYKYGVSKYIKVTGAKLLDQRKHPVTGQTEALFRLMGLSVLVCTCPSQHKTFAMRTPPTNLTCEDAHTWLQGREGNCLGAG